MEVATLQGSRGTRAVLAAVAVLMVVPGSTRVQAGAEQQPVLRVDLNASGEIGLDARGATIADTLQAIASKAGFEVSIEDGIERAPVNMVVSTAPVENVLRQILRGRNYALIYDANDKFVREVIVLPPPVVPRPAWRRGR